MLHIPYPEPVFQRKQEAGREYIFDAIRKKWLLLTPEEWVRQNFINYLTGVMEYPRQLIAVETAIRLGELNKRVDILVFDKEHRPWMMIECKAMEVPLDESVLQQLLRYNISSPVPYLVITNGTSSFGWLRTGGGFEMLASLPPFGK